MSKLWRVNIEASVPVLADSQEEAEGVVQNLAGDDAWGVVFHADLDAEPIKSLKDLKSTWYGSIPFGEEDDHTCKRILEAAAGEQAEQVLEADQRERTANEKAATPSLFGGEA